MRLLEKDAEERRHRRKMNEDKANGGGVIPESENEFLLWLVAFSIATSKFLCPHLTRSIKGKGE